MTSHKSPNRWAVTLDRWIDVKAVLCSSLVAYVILALAGWEWLPDWLAVIAAAGLTVELYLFGKRRGVRDAQAEFTEHNRASVVTTRG